MEPPRSARRIDLAKDATTWAGGTQRELELDPSGSMSWALLTTIVGVSAPPHCRARASVTDGLETRPFNGGGIAGAPLGTWLPRIST